MKVCEKILPLAEHHALFCVIF